MADTLEARREQRRKRILENAENRLRKITNANSSEIPQPNLKSTREEGNESSAENWESCEVRNTESPVRRDHTRDILGKLDQMINSAPFELPTIPSNNVQQSKLGNILSHRYYILFAMGFIVSYWNFLIDKSEELLGVDVKFMHISQIFVPFLLLRFTEFMWNFSATLNSFRNSNRIVLMLTIFNAVMLFFKDMSLYFFAFVFLDLVISVFDIENFVF